MIYKGIEYRILVNGTRDEHKIQILKEFMGFKVWQTVYFYPSNNPNLYVDHLGKKGAIKKILGISPQMGVAKFYEEDKVRVYPDCDMAKAAAMKLIDEPERNVWSVCEC